MQDQTDHFNELITAITKTFRDCDIDPFDALNDAVSASSGDRDSERPGLAAKSREDETSSGKPALFPAWDELITVSGVERLFLTDGEVIYLLLFDNEHARQIVFDGEAVDLALLQVEDMPLARLNGFNQLFFVDFLDAMRLEPERHMISLG